MIPVLKLLQTCPPIGVRHFHRWLAPTLRCLKRRKNEMGPEPPRHRNTFIEWNYNAELYAFGKRLGEEFDKDILIQALTERSYITKEEKKQQDVGIETGLNLKDNNELAEKGEELIKDYVESFLKLTLPRLPQVFIFSIRDFLLSDDSLAKVSKNIGTDDLILSADFPLPDDSLARALKGLTQALVLSSGEDRACTFIRDFILTQLVGKDLTPFCTPSDPFETLLKILNEEGKTDLEPRFLGKAGCTTLLSAYYVGLYTDKKLIGKGFGETVEVATDMGACDALWRRWGITQRRKPFPFSTDLHLKHPIKKISAI